MKISTVKEKILNAILIAERITGKKETLPVLSCVLFDVDKDLLIRGTNLEAGIEIRIQSDIEEKGKVAVSAAVLSQTLRSIGGEKVTFKTNEGNLIIDSKGTKTLIKAIPNDEFPVLSGNGKGEGITVPRERFIRALQAVSYAASPSMIRPELGSVYVSVKGGELTCVATDSFRLAEKILKDAKGKGKSDSEILIPLKHALEIIYILERSNSEEVSLSTDESQLTVTTDGVRYVSRIVEGTFPNYSEIIPKTFITEATVLKNDFSEMLKKARVFAGADQYVGLHVYPKRKIFTAIAQSADVGEMSDFIDAAVSGEDVDINFHIGYLSDCLTSIESDSIILSFAGAGKPLVIRGVSDPSFTYLVMPLNR